MLKVRLFKNTTGHRPFFENLMKIWKFHKFEEIWFFNRKSWRSCPIECGRSVDQAGTLSLRGPKKIYTASREAASLMGWMDAMDGMGWTEDQMGPSIFFILCGYIVYVYMFLYTCSKFVTNIVMGLKIWSQVGLLTSDFQNHNFSMIFLKSC